jgi:hypothetical protein
MDRKLKQLRETWSRLGESKKSLPVDVWFHGDPNKRSDFCDQKMDRQAFVQDPNANGPGIYFTKDYGQARGYGEGGYVYTCRIDSSAGKIIRETDDAEDHQKFLFRLLKRAQSYDAESVWYAVTDYGHEVVDPSGVRDGHLKEIIRGWSGIELIGAAVMVYKEFFGRDANEWAKAMSELGMLGFLQSQPETDHLIVYNCEAIEILKEERVE